MSKSVPFAARKPGDDASPAAGSGLPPVRNVLGTSLQPTTYEQLTRYCVETAAQGRILSIDFTNTMIVTKRRHEPDFQKLTSSFDHFIPDGMPLIWCLNLQGAGLRDRVYGPTFMAYALEHAPETVSHYFLGGSEDCLNRLQTRLRQRIPRLRIAGAHHGFFNPEQEPAILEEIHRLAPDFVWIGLGTPKQQDWIHRWKPHLKHGIVLAVGFAFDVNAGTKPDAPLWMQRRGLTWLFRLASEPRRLAGRYLHWNSLFLFYLAWDGLRGRALSPTPQPPHPR